MSRPAAALLATAALAVVASAPAPAAAQVWPSASGVTAIAAWLRPATPQLDLRPMADPGAPVAPRPETAPRDPVRLNLRPVHTLEAPPPKVELRAKDEWTDDQGFRATATRVAYKVRF